MSNRQIVLADCERVVAQLGREWKLPSAQAAAYAQAIADYVREPYTEAQLQRLALCYHLDHQEVQALRDLHHPGYQDAWARWPDQVLRFLHDANLDWVNDGAIGVEDLVQIALKEIHESIASYRFNSRFSTWAYTVILRGARHAVRAQYAAKRSATLVAIDDPAAAAQLSSSSDDPVAMAQNAELIAVIKGILLEHGGPRWVEIFQCWIQEDKRLVDIGRQVGISVGRVSVLIDHMRSLLRNHKHMRAWYLFEAGQGDADSVGEKQLGDATGESTA